MQTVAYMRFRKQHLRTMPYSAARPAEGHIPFARHRTIAEIDKRKARRAPHKAEEWGYDPSSF